MASFAQTINPCPFGFFSAEPAFQQEADAMVQFVLNRLGAPVLSVELTKKQIWQSFEEAACEYSRLVNEMRLQSDIINILGQPTGSIDYAQTYMYQTQEFLFRQTDRFASSAGIGGMYDPSMGYINLVGGKQDYNIYNDLIDASKVTALAGPINASQTSFAVLSPGALSGMPMPFNVSIGVNGAIPFEATEMMQVTSIVGNILTVIRGVNASAHSGNVQAAVPMYLSQPSGSRGKIEIIEIFHFEPFAAQSMLLNASNITNFLATNFNYESYVNSTIFYVLPVFEDVLRRSMLETAFRVRRSNYSYEIHGTQLRIYPIPTSLDPSLGGYGKLWIKVYNGPKGPMSTNIGGSLGGDDSINGINSPAVAPYGNISFSSINQPGRQWLRQYTVALCKEMLGLIRGKMKTIPIPGSELQLNADDLLTQGREDQVRLRDQLKEWLSNFTTQKLLEMQAAQSTALMLSLKSVPFRHAIKLG